MTDSRNLTGQVALVTGATGGIGREIARRLGARGAHVVLTGRSRERGEETVAAVERAGGSAQFFRADLAAMATVRALAEEFRRRYDRLDVLVTNAGCSQDARQLTADGHELTLAVNHLAPYLLTHDLLDMLVETPDARIVATSSTVHSTGEIDFADLRLETDYEAFAAYARSKLANLLFTTELAVRVDIPVNAVHPGFVPGSGLYRHASLPTRAFMALAARLPVLSTSVSEAADPLVDLAVDPDADHTYFDRHDPTDPDPRVGDDRLREHLWNVSAALVDVDPDWP
ncbi:SDR family NAD(P)-dependent oxidoreductase [Halococcus dombrowskii]|uniref:SDR family NAD(P)-dependent oxidoreductase n=1 Tax=Halococcus dombrowskii TaxID=179637 RepID=A0AAV3SMU7_HALDO|nr:SDR family NAD(P)-dependent oxidoreductase [Halococcus dombrowskii]UOO95413.1 SDR family NAD(P)-dependent oxidoreductase [Halococcus dombrowskii]